MKIRRAGRRREDPDHGAADPARSGDAYAARRARARWRFSALNLAIALFLLGGLSLFTYPAAAGWVSAYNQSHVLVNQSAENSRKGSEQIDAELALAHQYNDQLQSKALYSARANVVSGTGSSASDLDYWKLVESSPGGVMARLKIPSISVDLPIYHGTSDATLLKGGGHLEGTSLPVGGPGTRAVLAAHRGLAHAAMFNDLDKVREGDRFSIGVLNQVLTYKVVQIEVVTPDATQEIRPASSRDLVTLVTCTPMGMNTHRILVTGERTPATSDEIAAMNRPPTIRFPWWLVIYVAGVVVIGTRYWLCGLPKRPRTAGRPSAARRP